MKRWILMAGLAILMLGLLGCGRKKEEEKPVESTPAQSFEETTEGQEISSEEMTGEETTVTGETVGNILRLDFEQRLKETPELTAQEMADHLLSNSIIQFGGATMAVEEGLLTGFNNAEITGFEEGVMFAPMIGSIPFVGYVFTLPQDGDIDAFIQLLTDNADPRWNICTEAEETVTGQVGNMVFFVMSPKQFE